MQNNFPESDWKTLSRLRPLALDRLCQRILQESGKILDDTKKGGSHKAYLELYKHIHTSDETVINCFDSGATRQALNFEQIKDFNISAPPLSLQEEFAGVVARVESLRGRMGESARHPGNKRRGRCGGAV